MSASLRATVVELRYVEDEVSLARSKPSKQALDTISQVLANVSGARDRLRLAHQTAKPDRQQQLRLALEHLEGALDAARTALRPGGEEQLQSHLNAIVEHLVMAAACADEDPWSNGAA